MVVMLLSYDRLAHATCQELASPGGRVAVKLLPLSVLLLSGIVS